MLHIKNNKEYSRDNCLIINSIMRRMIATWIPVALFSLVLMTGCAGKANNSGNIPYAVPPEGIKNWLSDHPFNLVKYSLPDNILEEETFIPMRDGIMLAVTVFREKNGIPVPVITTATPYGKDNFDQWDLFRDPPIGTVPGGGGFYMGNVRISDRTPFEAPDPGFWVQNGYAVVLVDLPGFGKSESNPEANISHHDRWIDIMEWIEKQPWSTGKVGMSGVSALAATQWIAAMSPAPEQLKAIIAWEGMNETGPGGGYGGIPEKNFGPWVSKDLRGPSINHKTAEPEPGPDEWHFNISTIEVPALICASFSDQELHTWDTFDAFTRIKSEDKWLYNHRRQKWEVYYGEEGLALQKRFMDKYLKGDDNAMDSIPPVRLEINENRFDYKVVEVADWPVPDTEYRKLYLNAATNTLTSNPLMQSATSTFSSSPIGDSSNRALFDYTFSQDMDIVGYMALKLYIEIIDAHDADLFVGVEKIDKSGDKVYFFSSSGGNANGPVSRGWLRVSKRELNTERSTPWRPVLSMQDSKPLKQGEIVEVNIPIMPSGTTFRTGETLRLVVQSWSAPGQWEGGETRDWDTLPATIKLHTGDNCNSHLLIPVVSFSHTKLFHH